MKDNVINFSEAKKEKKDGFESMLKGLLDVMYESMREPIKKSATEIKDNKLHTMCEKFITTSEEVIKIFEEDKKLEKYSHEDKTSFVSAVDFFAIKLKDFCSDIMREDLKSRLEGK